jgi:hypothetical protein
VWAWMFRRSDDPAALDATGEGDGPGDGVVQDQLPSGVWNTSMEYGVDPVGVVGETTTPTSQ